MRPPWMSDGSSFAEHEDGWLPAVRSDGWLHPNRKRTISWGNSRDSPNYPSVISVSARGRPLVLAALTFRRCLCPSCARSKHGGGR